MAELRVSARWARTRPLAVLMALALALSVVAGTALAVHQEGLFELDENAVANGLPGDDWDLIADGDPANDGAFASEFVTDPFEDPATDHVFAQNSKDTLDISGWAWKFGSPEDKNDIEHAFTALYMSGAEQILYFGIDRMANNGDAAIGLWFLQDEVDQVDNGRVNKPWSGVHVAGDLLVQTDFTQGGTIERLDVYMWDCDGFFGSAADCVAEHPGATLVGGDLWRIGEETECEASGSDDLACAEVNDSVVTAPWDYSYKCVGSSQPPDCAGESGVTELDVFPISTFFEGGINLTDVYGGEAVCLASMVAETRSSQSETSTLDDKALGNLDICGDIAATKYKDVNADGARDADGADNTAGTQDDEVGLAGWTVFIDRNADGIRDADGVDNVANTADDEVGGATNSSGTFTFTDLPPGSYSICEVQQTNWDRTDPSTILPCKTVSPGAPGVPTSVLFGNTPLSNFDVRFFDLTGATDATVSCVLSGTTTPQVGTSATDEAANPETTYTANGKRIGTYVCTIVITDP